MVGGVRVDRVVESEAPILDPLQMFPQATHRDIEAQLSWLTPRFYDPASKLLVIPIQGFLIRAGGRTIVVDTCVGDCKDRARPMFNNQQRDWIGRLRALGVAPESVDYVLLTHFHVDHVGWNTRLQEGRWVPAFPNARYLMTREEWDYWRSPEGKRGMERTGDYIADSVAPVVECGQADFVPMNHEVADGVRLLPAAGHTPGFVCVEVSSSGERLVLASDLLHSPLQCKFPEWPMRYCADPSGSAATRVRFLGEWAKARTLVMPTHFPSPSAGYVERSNGSFRFQYLEHV